MTTPEDIQHALDTITRALDITRAYCANGLKGHCSNAREWQRTLATVQALIEENAQLDKDLESCLSREPDPDDRYAHWRDLP